MESFRCDAFGFQGFDLVGHEGYERGDDESQAGQQQGRQLVAQRLPSACRQDPDHILTGDYGVNEGALAGPEAAVAEETA